MLKRNGIFQQGRLIIRQFSQTRTVQQLPSSGEMKSEDQWISTSQSSESNTESSNSAIFRVVQSARSLQDNASREPPLNVNFKFTKRFEPGRTYDPFDFSMDKLAMEERSRFKNNKKDIRDPFVKSGINPLDLYTMPEILSKFLTSTGQILPRDVTGCSSSNQKKLGMAVKRARACGILSSVHKHARFLPQRNL